MCTCLWFRTKTELATTIGGYTERMLQDHEQLDQLSIQADMWRSKFMATRCDIPTATCLCACSAGYCYLCTQRTLTVYKHGITRCFNQPKRCRVNVCVCVCINSVLIDQLSRERDDVSNRWQLSKTALEQLLQERQQLHENMVQTHR